MLEILDSASDVIALRISHKITGAELDAVMDRLDRVMSTHETVHVFVETQQIDGVELSGLAAYTTRAMPLFSKLDRFGRVAVVADQSWIRAGTRLESAMLPGISYRTFEPADREAAYAWVNGART